MPRAKGGAKTRRRRKKILKKAKGFTLVELIAVVSVILILVAIVVPRIGDLRGQASNARAQSARIALKPHCASEKPARSIVRNSRL